MNIAQQIVNDRAVGLILYRQFQSPLFVVPAKIDLVVTILNDDAIDFIAIEIYHLAGATGRFFGVRNIAFDKPHVGEHGCGDD